MVEPTVEEIEQAWLAFERGEAAQAGIVDHVSFQVMRRLGITEAFTNDKHYQAAGFTVLFYYQPTNQHDSKDVSRRTPQLVPTTPFSSGECACQAAGEVAVP